MAHPTQKQRRGKPTHYMAFTDTESHALGTIQKKLLSPRFLALLPQKMENA